MRTDTSLQRAFVRAGIGGAVIVLALIAVAACQAAGSPQRSSASPSGSSPSATPSEIDAGSHAVAVAVADIVSQPRADRNRDACRLIHPVGHAPTAGRGDSGFGRHQIPDFPQAG